MEKVPNLRAQQGHQPLNQTLQLKYNHSMLSTCKAGINWSQEKAENIRYVCFWSHKISRVLMNFFRTFLVLSWLITMKMGPKWFNSTDLMIEFFPCHFSKTFQIQSFCITFHSLYSNTTTFWIFHDLSKPWKSIHISGWQSVEMNKDRVCKGVWKLYLPKEWKVRGI